MAALAVVVTLDPEGQIALQLLGRDQGDSIFIEVDSSFKVEKKLSNTALSLQQPLADMLGTISRFLSGLR